MYLAQSWLITPFQKLVKSLEAVTILLSMHAYNKIKTMLAEDDQLEIELTTIRNKFASVDKSWKKSKVFHILWTSLSS